MTFLWDRAHMLKSATDHLYKTSSDDGFISPCNNLMGQRPSGKGNVKKCVSATGLPDIQ